MSFDFQPGVNHLHKCWDSGNMSKSGVSSVIFQYESGHVVMADGQACHAVLRRAYGPNFNPGDTIKDKVKYIISGIGRGSDKNVTKEVKRTYLNWLFNSSPYQDVFACKHIDWCIRNECVVANTNVPANLLTSALITSRRLWEKTTVSVSFHELVSRGTPPNLAYLMSHCFKCIQDSNEVVLDQNDLSSNHCNVSVPYMSNKRVKGWCNGELYKDSLDSKLFKDSPDYGPIVMLNSGPGGDENFLHKACIKFEPKEVGEEEAKDINPFKKAKIKHLSGYKRFNRRVFFDQIVDHLVPYLVQEVENA